MSDINEIIRRAKELEITLTNADLGTPACDMWVARVELAASYFDNGRMMDCMDMIVEANRVAI